MTQTKSSYYIRNELLAWLQKMADQDREVLFKCKDTIASTYRSGRITAFDDVANKLMYGWHALAKKIGEVER
jgi:hypothetical protein